MQKKGAYFDVRELVPKSGGYVDEVVLGEKKGQVFLKSIYPASILDTLRHEGLLNDSRGDDVEVFIHDDSERIEVMIDQRPVLYLYFRPTKKMPSMQGLI